MDSERAVYVDATSDRPGASYHRDPIDEVIAHVFARCGHQLTVAPHADGTVDASCGVCAQPLHAVLEGWET